MPFAHVQPNYGIAFLSRQSATRMLPRPPSPRFGYQANAAECPCGNTRISLTRTMPVGHPSSAHTKRVTSHRQPLPRTSKRRAGAFASARRWAPSPPPKPDFIELQPQRQSRNNTSVSCVDGAEYRDHIAILVKEGQIGRFVSQSWPAFSPGKNAVDRHEKTATVNQARLEGTRNTNTSQGSKRSDGLPLPLRAMAFHANASLGSGHMPRCRGGSSACFNHYSVAACQASSNRRSFPRQRDSLDKRTDETS